MSEGASDPKGMPHLLSKSTAKKEDSSNEGSVPGKRSIIMVRHGSTKLNDPDNERIRGWNDVPLDEKGKKEAEAVGERLKGLVDVIVASDLKRTQETAKSISEKTGAPIVAFSKALRPWNVGVFTSQPVKLILNDLYTAAKRSPDEVIPEGESFNQFKDRFLKEMEQIEKNFPDKRVAVVAHHRNQVLYDAWKKKGAKSNLDFDWDTFASKGIDPGDFQIH